MIRNILTINTVMSKTENLKEQCDTLAPTKAISPDISLQGDETALLNTR